MKTKTAAEQLADRIIDYLRDHQNSTQAQMQIAHERATKEEYLTVQKLSESKKYMALGVV